MPSAIECSKERLTTAASTVAMDSLPVIKHQILAKAVMLPSIFVTRPDVLHPLHIRDKNGLFFRRAIARPQGIEGEVSGRHRQLAVFGIKLAAAFGQGVPSSEGFAGWRRQGGTVVQGCRGAFKNFGAVHHARAAVGVVGQDAGFLQGDVLAAAVRPVFNIGFADFDASALHVYIKGIGGGGGKGFARRGGWESERGAEGGAVQRQLQAHGVCGLRPEDGGACGLSRGGCGGQFFEGGRRARGLGFTGDGVESSFRCQSGEGVGQPVRWEYCSGTRLEVQDDAAHAV